STLLQDEGDELSVTRLRRRLGRCGRGEYPHADRTGCEQYQGHPSHVARGDEAAKQWVTSGQMCDAAHSVTSWDAYGSEATRKARGRTSGSCPISSVRSDCFSDRGSPSLRHRPRSISRRRGRATAEERDRRPGWL